MSRKEPTPLRQPCLVCGASFQPTRPWHRFCSDRCRAEGWKDKNLAVAEYACEYCGAVANTIDHVPPTVAREKIVALGLAGRYPFVEVRACHECNSALNDRALWTVAQRKRWIKTWLKRRYRKYLKTPEWSDSELAQLGPGLQRLVMNGIAVQEYAQARVSY